MCRSISLIRLLQLYSLSRHRYSCVHLTLAVSCVP
ncbi:hypothetical protein M6B38_223645 [Iris pallida]|uniref:Uncharacterized protein n=1 Tax=Iris pallida TaxID=29817 RepID=A0AAX6DW20_IRIPA|nr:hypothetical protein M6B38_223645 [Iris pallida]